MRILTSWARLLVLLTGLFFVPTQSFSQDLGEDCFSAYRGAISRESCPVKRGLIRVSFHSFFVCLPPAWGNTCQTSIDTEDYWFGKGVPFSIRIHRLFLSEKQFSLLPQEIPAQRKRVVYILDSTDNRVMAELIFDLAATPATIGDIVGSFQFRGHVDKMKFFTDCGEASTSPTQIFAVEDGERRQIRLGDKFTRDFGVLDSFSCESVNIIEAVQRSENDWVRYEVTRPVSNQKRGERATHD